LRPERCGQGVWLAASWMWAARNEDASPAARHRALQWGLLSGHLADGELDVDLSAAHDKDASPGWRIVVAVDAPAHKLEVGPARRPKEEHCTAATYRCGERREACPEGVS
jgi:hypothetical protein